ncbi:flagellar motor protein MotB [Sinomonas halotolerans]|uniref:Flagellar motor protein MotB n=1 Tax=Sinomonas halotolerans TaxID=1644133 RepID=A0ABU9WYQ7_9MICC
MSSRRRRRGGGGHGEDGHDERWLVSYADMVTVLMITFIVLFAMSSVDAQKFEKLRNSLATGFGQTEVGKVDTATGTVVRAEDAGKDAEGFSELALARKEAEKLLALKAAMEKGLGAKGLARNVELTIDQRGLSVRLVGAQTFFLADRPELTARAAQVIDVVGPVIRASRLEVSVEGHAAHGVTAYPSTWELSGARAIGVLRRLVEHDGVARGKVGAVAYGSARQVTDDSTEELMERNRRVDIVILSDQPEKVRAFIPDALKAIAVERKR